MSLMRIIFLFIVGYFFYKGVKYLIRIFTERHESVDSSMNTNYTKASPNKSKIDKKDIIDADFEEIEESKKTEN